MNAVCAGVGARNPHRFGVKIKGVDRRVTQFGRGNRQDSRTGADV